jgi:membrane protease YdiL (CAAX protease family)
MIPRFKRQRPEHQESGDPILRAFCEVPVSERSSTAIFSSPQIPDSFPTRSRQDIPTVPVIPTVRDILPDGEAILQPPMDNTPNDAPGDAPHRIPHLGHALLFLAITGLLLLLTQLALLGVAHPTPAAHSTISPDISPKVLVASEAFTYLVTLILSWFLFPLLWKRSFPDGIHANPAAARRNAIKLIPIGLALSFTVQAVSSLITLPKNIPMDDFFRTSSDIWIITIFGTLLAPLFEEVLFRGFLLPAFAISYDWLSLPRTPAARDLWNSTNKITLPALIFSAILTSILFTALHGQQVAYAWPVLCLLFCVSLVLTYIRLRLRSVLASTLVHASYNFTIFLTAFVATGGYRHLDKMTH